MSATDLIDAYLAHLTLAGRSDYTTRTWSRVLRHADRELPHGLDQAAPSELGGWIARPHLSPATRFSYFTALSRFYAWTCAHPDERLRLVLDPMQDLPRQRMPAGVPHPCTDAELEHLLQHLPERLRRWALLAAYAGTRCIEIGRLDREHIGPDVIRLLGKGDRPGTIPTHELIWQDVQDLPPGPIAVGRWGQRITGVGVSARWRDWLLRKLGIRGLGLHRLRHRFLTRALEVCGDLRVVQELARHSSPATTARYTQVAAGRLAEVVAALPIPPAGSAALPAGPAGQPQ